MRRFDRVPLVMVVAFFCAACSGVAQSQGHGGDGALLLRPVETTSAEYEVIYQTFIGQPMPALEMRTKVRVEYQEEGGYRLQFLSMERFEPFPAPGGWMKITVDPVMLPGGDEPVGVDIDFSHRGAPMMLGVAPPDIPDFSATFISQLMMLLYLVDGTLDLDQLEVVGDSIEIPGYTYSWGSDRYTKIQRKVVPESSLRVDAVGEELIDLMWETGLVVEYKLLGFDYELMIIAMEETIAWRLQVDPETGLLEHAMTENNVLHAVQIADVTEIKLPEEIEIPADGERYRTDRLIQVHRLDK